MDYERQFFRILDIIQKEDIYERDIWEIVDGSHNWKLLNSKTQVFVTTTWSEIRIADSE